MHVTRAVIAIGAATAALLGPAGTAEATKVSYAGNASAIAFYRQVVKATRQEGGLKEVLTYFTYIKPTGNGYASWFEGAGVAKVPAGFVPVLDNVTMGDKDGRVAWVRDVFTPMPGCKNLVPGDCGSYLVVLNRSGLFERSLLPGAPVCSEKVTGSVLYMNKVGGAAEPFGGYQLQGRFSPLRTSGHEVYVTSTFSFGKVTATEVDTVSAITKLPSAGVDHVAQGPGFPAINFRWTISWSKSVPAAPSTTVCQ